MADNKRLIICLDGTWNRQDNSTNVLHHFNVVHKGLDPKTGMDQKKYYHPGVGTGPLDRITGGGFGFGLEQNVRDAYNWLVGNYCDRPPGEPQDEIYIFGFSRGAYTARSLVGFIGRCGLLRRGAPITVDQLWDDYCILGRQKEERTSAWDWMLWKEQPRIRQITELTSDPWSKKTYKAGDLSENEKLLIHWSRRVRITYLGVFDTVGSIGWDALAIPGLTSRMALHNNMRPTTLIQHCRHALALDENRANFNHTPFEAYVGYDVKEADPDAGDPEADAQTYWTRQRAMWHRKIEQRWFVGAHSNIGGGYEDNRLAERPLEWILEGAIELGMVADTVPFDPPVTCQVQVPRDSQEEFAPPLWTKIIRAKRNYRRIDPPAVPQAGAPKPGVAEPAGFSLETIHETIDESVRDYWGNSELPLAPNLEEYLRRKDIPIGRVRPAVHEWLKDRWTDYVALITWATLAVIGVFAVFALIGYAPASPGSIWIACVVAFVLPVVDWGESAGNFRIALGLGSPGWRAFLDAIFWTRLLAFVLWIFGVVYAAVALLQLGWSNCFPDVIELGKTYWGVPVCAAAAALVLGKRGKPAWISVAVGPALVALVACILFGLGRFATGLFPELSKAACPAQPVTNLSEPGLLLLLQLALLYFWRALVWVDDPMAKANLESIVPLQKCPTPAEVEECLERWRKKLECRWLKEDAVKGPAAVQMRELVGVCLWRDIIGFIPVYTLVFVFGLWFAVHFKLPGSEYLTPAGIPLWWALPALAATTDYLEDICHLRFRKLHEWHRMPPPATLAFFSWCMSKIKDGAWVVSGILTGLAVLVGTWEVRTQLADWRAKVAWLISVTALLVLLAWPIALAWHRFFGKRGKHPLPATSVPQAHGPVTAMSGK